jgi:Domain of unknown function (DUF397)
MAKTDSSHVTWRKGSRSGGNGGACIEIADMTRAVAVRDSKDPDGGMLAFSPSEWSTFADRIKGGDLTCRSTSSGSRRS